MTAAADWLGLREIDAAAGTSKGAAFRAFKALQAQFTEGRDYVVLHAERDRATIEQLRASGRIYRGSINVILLSPAAARRIGCALHIDAPVR
ncbi:hypothetical protein AAG565_00125 [Fontimonas sp. SYSU GA230001]|uniref:hypothetical protein n=1 Tax=Fontimonas sp. SYSU GA230001 TaxID=3142450 RepID=UPI0032B4FF35